MGSSPWLQDIYPSALVATGRCQPVSGKETKPLFSSDGIPSTWRHGLASNHVAHGTGIGKWATLLLLNTIRVSAYVFFAWRGEHCGTGVPPVNHGRDGRATIWLRPSGSLKIWPGQNPQEELHSEEDSPYATWLLAHPCLPSLDSMSGGLDRLQTVKMAILHAKESAASL